MKKTIKLILMLIFLAGCQREKIITEKEPVDAWVWGVLSYYYPDTWIEFHSNPLVDTSLVECKVFWSDTEVIMQEGIEPGYILFKHDDIQLFPESLYTVYITSPFGDGSCSLRMPGIVDSTFPSEDDTISLEEATVKWSRSPFAKFYEIECHINAYDSAGRWVGYEHIENKIVYDTFFVLNPYLEIPEAVFYEVNFHFTPYNGALDSPNMEGDLKGYIFTKGWEEIFEFYIRSF